MFGIMLLTHGNFGAGILDSAQTITGKEININNLSLDPGMSTDKFYKLVMDKIIEHNQEDGILALVDIFGGTPSNCIYKAKKRYKKNIKIVAGVNLPMLLELIEKKDSGMSLDEIATDIVAKAKSDVAVLA